MKIYRVVHVEKKRSLVKNIVYSYFTRDILRSMDNNCFILVTLYYFKHNEKFMLLRLTVACSKWEMVRIISTFLIFLL